MVRSIRPLDRPDPGLARVAKTNGFSLHAGVSCEGHQKDKRQRPCRYTALPALATPRLPFSHTGKVVYTLKTPYRDGPMACPTLSGINWAQRLKRLFNIDIKVCGRCGDSVKVISDASDRCIKNQDIIDWPARGLENGLHCLTPGD